jgi:hypothetical protein
MNPTVKNHSEKIKGYKAMKKDKNGFYTDGMGNAEKVYFKKGQVIEIDGDPVLCSNGIHFFRNIAFAIDYLENNNAIFEIESIGDVQEDTEKCVTNKIKVGSKVTLKQLKDIFDDPKKMNSGNCNSGYRNSGDWNSGDSNSGNRNSGDWNSGNRNSGDSNSGNRNSGDSNSGDSNSGNCNSGNWNSGNRNSGNWNSGDSNSGNCNSGNWNSGDSNSGNCNSCNGYKNYFCTKTKYFLFDVEVKKQTIDKLTDLDFYSWFELEEKGKEGYKKAWSKMPDSLKSELKSIPQFKLKKNKLKFKEITGINL